MKFLISQGKKTRLPTVTGNIQFTGVHFERRLAQPTNFETVLRKYWYTHGCKSKIILSTSTITTTFWVWLHYSCFWMLGQRNFTILSSYFPPAVDVPEVLTKLLKTADSQKWLWSNGETVHHTAWKEGFHCQKAINWLDRWITKKQIICINFKFSKIYMKGGCLLGNVTCVFPKYPIMDDLVTYIARQFSYDRGQLLMRSSNSPQVETAKVTLKLRKQCVFQWRLLTDTTTTNLLVRPRYD